ncbi:SNF2 domain-containing protein CLASSY 4-like [Heracleum sosnowskyi]|uniref:SNF2 domain-containing protein CLASSY 4-like n=1 Tax=Heracleum sosnowskyi TaxID=360622 RepID=A0AAD8GQ80_9APIA|nr:SNF2 domain-containing protein CLASSY 4-like [Heracleum sosnowskyi]
MEGAYVPVAKRTRSGLTKILLELAAKRPRVARDPAAPVEIIDISDDDDVVPTNGNKGAASKPRKREKSFGTTVDHGENDDNGDEIEGMDVDSETLSDSSSTESDDDETYRGDEIKSRISEKKNDKCKVQEKMVKRGKSEDKKNYKGKQITDESKLKRKEYTPKRMDSRKGGQRIPEAEKAGFHSFPEFDDGSGGIYVNKDVGGSKKNLTIGTAMRNAYKNLDHLKALGDSLNDKGEGLETYVENKLKYKFRFGEEEKEPVEESEFDKELKIIWAEAYMYLYPSDKDEEIDSTQPEFDNDDHSKSETGQATLCSQGNHPRLFLDEQIGIVCKCCSIVVEEIRHILPSFSKPSSSSRRRDTFVQSKASRIDDCLRSESPTPVEHLQDDGAKRHELQSYITTGSVWDLVPGARRTMYEHQREGFEFIWKNLAGDIIIENLEKPLSSSGSGCIISHAPGTGKTRLTIVFLQSFMKLYPDSRPLIIAPKSMLLTWEEEFKKWNINIPFHNMNNLEFSGQENQAAKSISKHMRGRGNNENVPRAVKMLSWKMNQSILGITYALFDKLVGAVTRNAGRTTIVEQMGEALLKLPSLVVLDEGHTPRNEKSFIYKSLLDVETKRRIILSGTPFQNNFTELYNTMCLVSSKFDGTSSESDDKMKKKLRRMGKEIQSRGSGEKLRELKCMISPFVHVHKGNILQKSCPGLKDALILLQPTELQQELIGVLGTNEQKAGHLDLIHAISLVSVHPSLLPERYIQEQQFSTYKIRLEQVKRDPHSGARTKFVMELCRLSEALNEKVLIYSQFIDPLMFTKKQLQAYFGWTEGVEVLYMDGCRDAKQRQTSINSLNDPRSKVRVLLASIKSCSEGIHLVGASRVVLLDVVWNPSVERQAISRAYRLGQKKMVYTYHLIAEEMEFQKYKTQTAKDRLSEMVFSSKDVDSFKQNMPDIVSEDKILQGMFQRNDQLGGLFKQIIYQPKESNLVDTFDLVAED